MGCYDLISDLHGETDYQCNSISGSKPEISKNRLGRTKKDVLKRLCTVYWMTDNYHRRVTSPLIIVGDISQWTDRRSKMQKEKIEICSSTVYYTTVIDIEIWLDFHNLDIKTMKS
jgi:hypothetical protein